MGAHHRVERVIRKWKLFDPRFNEFEAFMAKMFRNDEINSNATIEVRAVSLTDQPQKVTGATANIANTCAIDVANDLIDACSGIVRIVMHARVLAIEPFVFCGGYQWRALAKGRQRINVGAINCTTYSTKRS